MRLRSPCSTIHPPGPHASRSAYGSPPGLGSCLSAPPPPTFSSGLVQEPPGQMATPETSVRGREAPARSQEAPQGQLLIPCELLPGLAACGPAPRVGSPAQKRVEAGVLPLPVCIAAWVPELGLDAGALLQGRACVPGPPVRERREHRVPRCALLPEGKRARRPRDSLGRMG